MRPFLIIIATLLIVTGQAQAQANRTFVSGHGSDSNPCSLSAPCRSFAQALTQTNAGGEITVLDPAGYGPVTINKAISIVNDGVGEAGVTVASAIDAIEINIGASDVVNLRGLTLVGGGVGFDGILFAGLGGTLNIQDCVVRGFTLNGIDVVTVGTTALNVSDTIVSNVGSIGVKIDTGASGTVTAVFNRVQAIGGGQHGFLIKGFNATALDVTIANSLATNNTDDGIDVHSDLPGLAQVVVSHSVLSNNGTGVTNEGSNSVIYLSKNTIAGNTAAFDNTAGGLFSFGDNYIAGNSHDDGAIPLVATK